MEFERIGKNTVQCHMTVEEMNEYGLRIEDFFTNQEKSRDFLEQLVERAEEEIGYEVESGMISMQLMRMPDDSLIITFSDRGEDGLHQMLSQLQNLAGMIDEETVESIANAISRETGATMEAESHYRESMRELEEKAKRGEEKNAAAHRKNAQASSRVYRFEHLSLLESFAQGLQLQKNISSKLYRDEQTGIWYLLVKKGKLRLEEYQNVCRRLLEYGTLCTERPFMEQYCREHYRSVIGKHALQTIKEYIS